MMLLNNSLRSQSMTLFRLSITSLKWTINYLLKTRYFTLVSKCFCQLIGISMGSNPAPFMANVFSIIMKKSGFF